MVQSNYVDVDTLPWSAYIYLHKYEKVKRPTFSEFISPHGCAISSPINSNCRWINVFKVISNTL